MSDQGKAQTHSFQLCPSRGTVKSHKFAPIPIFVGAFILFYRAAFRFTSRDPAVPIRVWCYDKRGGLSFVSKEPNWLYTGILILEGLPKNLRKSFWYCFIILRSSTSVRRSHSLRISLRLGLV